MKLLCLHTEQQLSPRSSEADYQISKIKWQKSPSQKQAGNLWQPTYISN